MRAQPFPPALTALVLGCSFSACLSDERPSPGNHPAIDTTYKLGQAVPDLHFADLDGTVMTLSQYAAGQPVVLMGRDALCPVSRRYGPTTARLANEFSERGTRFLYVNVSPLDTPEAMREDKARYGLRGMYTDDSEWKIAALFGMITTAEVFLLDADRRLRYRGAIDDQYGIRFTKPHPRNTYLRDALEQLLDGDVVKRSSTLPEGCYLASEVRHDPDTAGNGPGPDHENGG
jgi:peroxiredoxin